MKCIKKMSLVLAVISMLICNHAYSSDQKNTSLVLRADETQIKSFEDLGDEKIKKKKKGVKKTKKAKKAKKTVN